MVGRTCSGQDLGADEAFLSPSFLVPGTLGPGYVPWRDGKGKGWILLGFRTDRLFSYPGKCFQAVEGGSVLGTKP